MRNLIPQPGSNPSRRRGHARPRQRIRDRLTPGRLRVWYGPDSGGGGFLWNCNRCDGRPNDDSGGLKRSLAGARAAAKFHARGHWFMRAVYEPAEEG